MVISKVLLMKALKRFTLFVCIITSFYGCPDRELEIDSTIEFTNNSDEVIIYYEEFKKPNDTALNSNSYFPTSQQIEMASIPADDVVFIEGPYVSLFESLENEVLMIFLFSKDTIDQVPWDRIRDEYLILRRYDLTLEDLEAMNWTIEYP